MARIDTAGRVLQVKIVHYGPAMGGKTTSLVALHALSGASRDKLMTLNTEGDRTLFFDLLPLDLGDVLGLKLEARLFTVPGQVHYDATRKLVLRDADAIVFVADSTPAQGAASAQSMRNLRGNLHENGMASSGLSVVVQANKQDVAGAVPPQQLAESIGAATQLEGCAKLAGIVGSSAVRGDGVLEAFALALHAAAGRAHAQYSMDRLGVSKAALSRAIAQALEPLERADAKRRLARPSAPAGASSVTSLSSAAVLSRAEDVVSPAQLLEESVKATLGLAESLVDQKAVSDQMQRRVQELETLQALARDLMGAESRREVGELVAAAARTCLPESVASLVVTGLDGTFAAAALAGVEDEPFLRFPRLADAVLRGGQAVAYADLDSELLFGDRELSTALAPFCSAAIAPVALGEGRVGALCLYGASSASRASAHTLRFLRALAGQAGVALQSAGRHERLLAQRGQLEAEVAAQTAELRSAHEELVAFGAMKDRILSSVNHEVRTPLTKLLSGAQLLERLRPGTSPPAPVVSLIVSQARHLAALFEQLLAAQAALAPDVGGADERRPVDLVRVLEAVVLSSQERATGRSVVVELEAGEPCLVAADAGALTLMVAQLVDNAVKFTRVGTKVTVRVLSSPDGRARVLVADQGPGVLDADAARIFHDFDQGSADTLTAKPQGLGLGLSVARRLARRHGGDVGLAPGSGARGATFWLELPALAAAAAGV